MTVSCYGTLEIAVIIVIIIIIIKGAFARRVIPFEMGHNHPGDHLQIAWNFNTLFTNICVGCVQNFT